MHDLILVSFLLYDSLSISIEESQYVFSFGASVNKFLARTAVTFCYVDYPKEDIIR